MAPAGKATWYAARTSRARSSGRSATSSADAGGAPAVAALARRSDCSSAASRSAGPSCSASAAPSSSTPSAGRCTSDFARSAKPLLRRGERLRRARRELHQRQIRVIAAAGERRQRAEGRGRHLDEHVQHRAPDHLAEVEVRVVEIPLDRHVEEDDAVPVLQERQREPHRDLGRVGAVRPVAQRELVHLHHVRRGEAAVLDLVAEVEVELALLDPVAEELAGVRAERRQVHAPARRRCSSVYASFCSGFVVPAMRIGDAPPPRAARRRSSAPSGSEERLVTFASAPVTFTTAAGVTERSTKAARPRTICDRADRACPPRRPGGAPARRGRASPAGGARRARAKLVTPSSHT